MIRSLFNKLTKKISDIVDKIKHKEPWYKYYGNNPRHLKYPDLTIYELVRETSESYPFNVAFSYYGRQITYKEFINNVKKIASALLEIGVSEGDIVTICMPNTPAAISMFYAINMVGGVASMIHPFSAENEIKLYLRISKTEWLITIDFAFNKVNHVLNETKVKKVITVSVADSMPMYMVPVYVATKGYKIRLERCDKRISWKEFIK